VTELQKKFYRFSKNFGPELFDWL